MHPEPASTYRLQLHAGFGFEKARAVIDYLADLGISHLYASPCLQAAAGSQHGYDVVDPGRVNTELGGAEAHARLCETLQSAGMGQVIDVVPNHMAIAAGENPWWWDVLENGPSSRFAHYFDIDWQACPSRWPGKMLLPVLGNHYGRVVARGEILLALREGRFQIHYFDHRFPVAPPSLAALLARAAAASGSDLLTFLAESLTRLPAVADSASEAANRRHRRKEILFNLLDGLCRQAPQVKAAIEGQVARLNHEPQTLVEFIDQQHYRPAFWRMAATDLGYRRFFDIKDLAGVRVEAAAVFRATHALPLAWVQKGWVQGLRIDHPDGLWDPAAYFHRLQAACPDAWILAEKILEPGEKLPPDWPVAGTTGYDFMNLAGGLCIDAAGEEPLTSFYEAFTGEKKSFRDLVRACKHLVLTELLASELNRLTRLFAAVCERHPRHRDYSGDILRQALCETAVCFPVYRSYVSASGGRVTPADEGHVEEAVAAARTRRPDLDPDLFRFLEDLLLLRIEGQGEGELAMRFQQLTGPAMAKGVEDTAFYRYHRLTALNEVGGDPGRFGVSPEQFHRACAAAQAERPLSMLASTTHDTKRSEDVRARLALLSEIPERWAEAVRRWAERNRRYRKDAVPDRNTEYLLYQTLVGAWPIDEERTAAYMQKAVREAKAATSWLRPDETYENGLRDFISAVMADTDFRADLEAFVAGLVTPGRINSLAQTLIKLTAPGVPDTYQGTELWDLSLVDPDNRRPVDFALRRRLLAEVALLTPEAIMARMDEGLPKLWLIRQALHLRRARPGLFGPQSSYHPVYARGPRADHVMALVRGGSVLAVAPRLVMGLADDWGDTALDLPPGQWHNILTGDRLPGGAAPLRTLLARFPVGLWTKEDQAQWQK